MSMLRAQAPFAFVFFSSQLSPPLLYCTRHSKKAMIEACADRLWFNCQKGFNGPWPAILFMVRGYSTRRDGADKICRTFVWICKEQALWLVSTVELLYTVIKRSDPTVSRPR